MVVRAELAPDYEREKRRYPYLTAMGPTGVGKTELAKRVAGPLGCILFTEEEATEGNPYLARSYQDFERWSFHSQVFFLLAKLGQLEQIWPKLSQGPVFHEPPHFEDTDIYAKARLRGPDWELYQNLYQALMAAGNYPQPDIVIYLRADLDHVMARIRQRAEEKGGKRLAELEAKPEYWQKLIRLNEEWARREKRIPILSIDTNPLNIVDCRDDEKEIIERIRQGIFQELWGKKGGIAPDGARLILPEGFL